MRLWHPVDPHPTCALQKSSRAVGKLCEEPGEHAKPWSELIKMDKIPDDRPCRHGWFPGLETSFAHEQGLHWGLQRANTP